MADPVEPEDDDEDEVKAEPNRKRGGKPREEMETHQCSTYRNNPNCWKTFESSKTGGKFWTGRCVSCDSWHKEDELSRKAGRGLTPSRGGPPPPPPAAVDVDLSGLDEGKAKKGAIAAVAGTGMLGAVSRVLGGGKFKESPGRSALDALEPLFVQQVAAFAANRLPADVMKLVAKLPGGIGALPIYAAGAAYVWQRSPIPTPHFGPDLLVDAAVRVQNRFAGQTITPEKEQARQAAAKVATDLKAERVIVLPRLKVYIEQDVVGSTPARVPIWTQLGKSLHAVRCPNLPAIAQEQVNRQTGDITQLAVDHVLLTTEEADGMADELQNQEECPMCKAMIAAHRAAIAKKEDEVQKMTQPSTPVHFVSPADLLGRTDEGKLLLSKMADWYRNDPVAYAEAMKKLTGTTGLFAGRVDTIGEINFLLGDEHQTRAQFEAGLNELKNNGFERAAGWVAGKVPDWAAFKGHAKDGYNAAKNGAKEVGGAVATAAGKVNQATGAPKAIEGVGKAGRRFGDFFRNLPTTIGGPAGGTGTGGGTPPGGTGAPP